MNIQNTDYDAAQALLDLQGNLKTESTTSYVWGDNERRENMEKEAKLFWNCFISSDIPSASNPILHANAKKISTNQRQTFPKSLQDFTNKNKTAIDHKENNSSYYRNSDNRFPKTIDVHSKAKPLPTLAPIEGRDSSKNMVHNNTSFWKSTPKTRDIGTQTEERYFNPNIEIMETTIKNLYERIQTLEARLKGSNNVSEERSRFASSEYEANYTNGNLSDESHSGSDMNEESNNDTHSSVTYSPNFDMEQVNYQRQSGEKRNSNILYNNRVLVNHNVYTSNYNNDLVPIGDGHASVPARILKHINWNSYTSATRKLLTAVFSRRILATHSLTGKPSPAFPNKPAKKKLDQKLVNDIVQTVVERCSVPENVVRTSITTKCADESKMFKTRQRNNKKRSNKKNRENISNFSSDSEIEKY